jgi:dihydrofolate reductase
MAAVVYSMGVSLDGYIAGPGGEIDWSAPGEELHRFHEQQTLELGAEICGRRLYEVMLYWEGPEATRTGTEYEREFARVWQALPKVVFSTTLASVEGNARLATGTPAEEVARLKEEHDKDLAVGGASLAAAFVERDLIDEYRLFVSPVVLGGGTPFFPPASPRLELQLLESRTFASRVVYSRYRRVR